MNKAEHFLNLSGKTAVITGASSGIGKAIAQVLASCGCGIIVLDISDQAGEQVLKELPKNTAASYYHCDVSSQAEVQAVAAKLANKKIDILINVAGISLTEQKGVASELNFERLISINLKSVYLTSMLIGHPLLDEGGAIVNISSIRAKTGTPSYSSGYAAAKAGVENLTKSFALELAEKNIRVNAIAPGATFPTGLSEHWSESQKSAISDSIPFKRMASPSDIAHAVLFLVSDLSTYITGQTLNVNGGAWMG